MSKYTIKELVWQDQSHYNDDKTWLCCHTALGTYVVAINKFTDEIYYSIPGKGGINTASIEFGKRYCNLDFEEKISQYLLKCEE